MNLHIGRLHLKIYIRQKEISKEDLLLQWIDALLASADFNDRLDEDVFSFEWRSSTFGAPPLEPLPDTQLRKLRNTVLSSYKQDPDDTQLDPLNKLLIEYHGIVEKFLLNEKYITKSWNQRDGTIWTLTEKGILAKELGGHKKYVHHRNREIKAIQHQTLMTWMLILATAFAAVMPWIVEWYKTRFQK